ncbi:NUMOD4 motif-containing HNH endonuclease [Lutimonas halocynthiae]|uniref:NUMOD4 motif-containing HNH endonuclease n=1 Tax=Lutimonas halocynthiae TaxID=1446477 RepID=UPI0025B5DA1E|nr:NUMOD4 motif-containing HNH endonuclease [Lutimonas halocynthiae]MDN3641161.1 NUMOD4 motif-containing HNH endonuclease [Lutimonas halocynthiae]
MINIITTEIYRTQFTKEGKTSSIETYKDILGYEGHYQISNLGNIKSLKRNCENVLSPSVDNTKGYYRICLYKKGKRKSYYVHQLVAIAFLNHVPNGNGLVVDHINNDKSNNKEDNLQIISNRENLSKDKWRHNPSSSYIGVSLHLLKKKWESRIEVNGTSHHLGSFKKEYEAGLEYYMALKHINNHSNLEDFNFKPKRKGKFVHIGKTQLEMNFC